MTRRCRRADSRRQKRGSRCSGGRWKNCSSITACVFACHALRCIDSEHSLEPASGELTLSRRSQCSSRPLSSSVTLSNDSVTPPTSTPPPPASARSEEAIIADRSTADSLPSTLSTEQEPSTTPSASPSSPTASHFALRHASTPADAPAGAPIEPFKPRDEVQAPPSRRVFVRGAVVQKDEEGLLQEVTKVLDLRRTQLTLWRRSTDEGETKRKG